MKTKQLLAWTLLVAATLCASSCDKLKDDDSWKPTWAVPLIKEMSLQLSDFVDSAQVDTFNVRIKEFWSDYVSEEIGLGGGQETVDSVAYEILTQQGSDGSYFYVSMGTDGVPQLNDATKTVLQNNGNSPAQIDSINSFLADYKNGSNTVSGDSAINNLLKGIVGNSKDVFTTAANLIDHMRTTQSNYIDSINNQLDSILAQANMNELISLNLNDLTQGVPVVNIKLDMDIKNTMPFKINFNARFVADSTTTLNVGFKDKNGNPIDSLNANASEESLSFDSGSTNLVEVFEKTTGVMLKIGCKKDEEPLSAAALRTLADKGITFSMRVKVQTGATKK